MLSLHFLMTSLRLVADCHVGVSQPCDVYPGSAAYYSSLQQDPSDMTVLLVRLAWLDLDALDGQHAFAFAESVRVSRNCASSFWKLCSKQLAMSIVFYCGFCRN